MAQVLQDNKQAVREAVASTPTGRTCVMTVMARLLEQSRAARMVTATVVSRRLKRLLPPGRLTRPRVARRGRAPGGARSSDRLGRTSGSRERRD